MNEEIAQNILFEQEEWEELTDEEKKELRKKAFNVLMGR